MGLRTKLAKSIEIIRATGALHKLEVILNDPVPEDDDIQQPDDYDVQYNNQMITMMM